jgi:hypothetical protein
MNVRMMFPVAVALGAGACMESPAPEPMDPEVARAEIVTVHEAVVSAMEAGTSTDLYSTAEWQGVNLNGTRMSLAGFEGEDRRMVYDSIQVLDRDVRVYGETAALRWHANFYVQVNGQSSFAEMRILDVYVRRDGRWLSDLMQVTPVYGTVGNPPAP